MTQICTVDDASRVAEVRRAAAALARHEGLDDTLTAKLALIVTELSTNLLKHAKGGEVCLAPLSERGAIGVEVLAIDRGPGMADIDRCLADGYSSAHTSGTGLGAVIRAAEEFDIYSEPGKGTVVLAQVNERAKPALRIGAIVKPLAGEDFSGDAWTCAQEDGALTVMVADGLGHGTMAARAAGEAVATFRRAGSLAPDALLIQAHQALRSTRGAAVAVMVLTPADSTVKFAGIGNIGGVICSTPKPQFMVSHPGTAGFGSPRVQVFSYAAPEGSPIVMHSDGLTTSWNIDDHPGLRRHHPSIVAGILYRDASRGRDDTCVVVAKSEKRV